MAWRLTNADLLSIGPLGTTSVKLESNTNFFFHENVFENALSKMATILSKGR